MPPPVRHRRAPLTSTRFARHRVAGASRRRVWGMTRLQTISTRALGLALVTASALGPLNPAASAATSVSNVTDAFNAPASAAAGYTAYVITSKTSASAALSGFAGAAVSVMFPAGTGFGDFYSGGSPISDGTNPIGGCYWPGSGTSI